MFLAVSVAATAIAPLMPATATATATAVTTPSCGASSAPLLPDICGWTRLAYRLNRMSGVGPRRLLQLGRTLRANYMEAEPEAVAEMRTARQYRAGYVIEPSHYEGRRRVGLLFFPGGLVHEAAYAPILRRSHASSSPNPSPNPTLTLTLTLTPTLTPTLTRTLTLTLPLTILRSVASTAGCTVICLRLPVRHPLAAQRSRLRSLTARVERVRARVRARVRVRVG